MLIGLSQGEGHEPVPFGPGHQDIPRARNPRFFVMIKTHLRTICAETIQGSAKLT
jgi:hypothetical protein